MAVVRPVSRSFAGAAATSVHAQPASTSPLLRARCTEALRKKASRSEFQRGLVSQGPDGELLVRTTGNQGSGVLSSMVQANGLIVLHHDRGTVAAGDMVDVMMFDGVI